MNGLFATLIRHEYFADVLMLYRVICGCLSAATSTNYPLQHPHIRRSAFYPRPRQRRRRSGEWGGGITFPSRLGVWGNVVSSPSGVRGRAPAENEFGAFQLYNMTSGGNNFTAFPENSLNKFRAVGILRQSGLEECGYIGYCLFVCIFVILYGYGPRVGRGTPFPPLLLPCPFTSSSFALYYLFPFSFFHPLYLFSFIVHPIPFCQNSPTPFPGVRL